MERGRVARRGDGGRVGERAGALPGGGRRRASGPVGCRRRWRGWRASPGGLAELRRTIGLAMLYPAIVLLLAYGLFVAFVGGADAPDGAPLTSRSGSRGRVPRGRWHGSGDWAPVWGPVGLVAFLVLAGSSGCDRAALALRPGVFGRIPGDAAAGRGGPGRPPRRAAGAAHREAGSRCPRPSSLAVRGDRRPPAPAAADLAAEATARGDRPGGIDGSRGRSRRCSAG